MAKRGADRQMTQDNWEEEDEAEEAGVFREASKEELQKRQFRRAKRRVVPGEASKAAPVFQGFAGFASAKTNSVGGVASTPSILTSAAVASVTAAVPPPATLASAQASQSSLSVPLAAPAGPIGASDTKPAGGSASVAATGVSASAGGRDPQFSVELKSLNEAVLDWIGLHVKKNAYCILTPVFEDYGSHLEKLRTKYPIAAVAEAASNGSLPRDLASSADSDKAAPTAKPSAVVAADASDAPAKSGTFTFQAAAPTTFAGFTKPATTAASTASAPALFSFGSGKPFTAFGSGTNVTTTGTVSVAAASTGGTKDASSNNKEPAAVSADSASLVSRGPSAGEAASLFKFGGLPSTQSSSLPASSLFQFGTKAGAPTGFGATGALFQFGTKAATSSGTDFGAAAADASKPGTSFLFQSIGSRPGASSSTGDGAATGGDDGEDNEEYVPPKPEVSNSVAEEGSVYSKRVKLFYKKDDSYVDKGIGNLFIKKVDAKTQLVLRADTNLGNILLNIVLNDKIPIVRQGTNNVSLVCIANPPMDPKLDASKPVALLLRVKSAVDADELAAELNKHKKQT